MFLPVFFSVLQICFIPGFIVYILLNRSSSDPKILLITAFSFGLSLIINYIIVLLFTYFHIYTRFALISLLIIELIILAAILVYNKIHFENYSLNKNYNEARDEIILSNKTSKSPYDLIRYFFLIMSLLLLIYLINILFKNVGKVFEGWDAIFSWNRWATDFFNNKMPRSTYHYPQLIPANWSIAYVLCKYPLQFIPKTIMHLFLILPVFSLIMLGIIQKKTIFYLASFFIFMGLGGGAFFWTDGFVDVPVAFFSIMLFVSLILIKEENNESEKKILILLSALFACGAAVTKQAGIFILIIYPILLCILVKSKFQWSYKKIVKFSLTFLFMLIIIVLPYYLWAESEIKNGNAASEISYITHDIFKGASYYERLVNACTLFSNVFSNRVIFVFCFVFFMVSFIDKSCRLLNLSFVIPYFVIWALFFSYSLRNAAIMIPYFSLGIGTGIDIALKRFNLPVGLIQLVKFNRNKIFSFVRLVLILFILIGIIILTRKMEFERLIESQNYRIKKLGEEEVNRKLYFYMTKASIDKFIVTDYQYLRVLPELDQHFMYGDIKSLEPSSKILNDESVGFLLWSPWYSDSTKFPTFINAGIKSGLYEEIFSYNGFRFIKLR